MRFDSSNRVEHVLVSLNSNQSTQELLSGARGLLWSMLRFFSRFVSQKVNIAARNPVGTVVCLRPAQK
jgi:hypothetical protein